MAPARVGTEAWLLLRGGAARLDLLLPLACWPSDSGARHLFGVGSANCSVRGRIASASTDWGVMGFRPDRFRCEVRQGRASAVVVVAGELDLATVGELESALQSLAKTKRAVTLDLRELRFVDSTGLRLILEIDAMARQDGFNFALVRGPETVQRIFAITGMEDHLVFVDAPEDLAPPT
jgi:anti-anti-sigma factor